MQAATFVYLFVGAGLAPAAEAYGGSSCPAQGAASSAPTMGFACSAQFVVRLADRRCAKNLLEKEPIKYIVKMDD